MTRALRTVAAIAIAASAAHVFAQSVTLRPGRYETTATIDMPGMKMPPQKAEECITAADLKDFSKKVLDPEVMRSCRVANSKVTDNKLTFDVICKEDDLETRGTTEITFGAESFTNLMITKDNKGRVTTIKGSAKRVGECGK